MREKILIVGKKGMYELVNRSLESLLYIAIADNYDDWIVTADGV